MTTWCSSARIAFGRYMRDLLSGNDADGRRRVPTLTVPPEVGAGQTTVISKRHSTVANRSGRAGGTVDTANVA